MIDKVYRLDGEVINIGEWDEGHPIPDGVTITDEEIVDNGDGGRCAASDYKKLRKYPSIQEQFDMQYWDSVNGTTNWADAISAEKEKHPKP